jgi:hypothetical protein
MTRASAAIPFMLLITCLPDLPAELLFLSLTSRPSW